VATAKKDEAPDGGRSGAKAANGDPAGPPAPGPENSEDPTAFILSRARSEVHLLLDNISANPDLTIAALTAQAKPRGLPKDWIEKVCEITWPPKAAKADPDEVAKQAALLIRTRDYLNGIAKPASGATIAFTLLVTQDTDSKLRRRRRPASGAPHTPSRTSLAAEAYPDLVEQARNFRVLLRWTLIFSGGVLFLTLLLSWYLAVGNAALADFAAARTALLEIDTRVGAAQSALNGLPPASTQPSAQRLPASAVQLKASPQRRPAPAPAAVPVPAPQQSPAPAPSALPATPPQQSQAPAPATSSEGQPKQSQAPAPNELLGPPPLATNYFLYPCARNVPSYPVAELRDACLARREQAGRFVEVKQGLDTWAIGAGPETAGWLANLLGSAVLPVLYGFLGAIASVVRTLSRKIKASLLSPRDVQLTFQQLALGAVVGACISLFIAAPHGGNGETSLLGPVALSSSAVSFVAGFGVESVFQALEALIARIFNVAPPATAARRETKAGS
jgi:hypothetical protein